MTSRKSQGPSGHRAGERSGGRGADRYGGDARPPAKPRPLHQNPAGPFPAAGEAKNQVKTHAPKPARFAAGFRRPSSDVVIIYGFHPVSEVLRSKKRKLLDLFSTEQAAERLKDEIAAADVTLHLVQAEELTRRLGGDAVHQGLLLEARPLAPLRLDEIPVQSGIVLVLDQITDPHNVGAILRTAAAYAVDAVVTTERHAPELSGVLAKAASGALEHVPVIEIVNLARGLEELGDLGYQRIGLDSEAPQLLQAVALARPVALVLGAEGKGLRRLTRENCDQLVRLDLPGPIKSLNVSNACAIALTLVSGVTAPKQ